MAGRAQPPTRPATLGQERPWTLIESSDPTITLEHGITSDHPTLLAAAGAFVRSPYEYRQIVYDDDEARARVDR